MARTYRHPVAASRSSPSPLPGLVGGVIAAFVLLLLVRVLIGAVFALTKVIVILGALAIGLSLYLRAKRSR